MATYPAVQEKVSFLSSRGPSASNGASHIPFRFAIAASRPSVSRSRDLESSFVGSSMPICRLPSLTRRQDRAFRGTTRAEMGGQYEETFFDIERQMLNCFTFKAVRCVLGQLKETNPPVYTYFYNFVVDNKPQDGKIFVQVLLKERQELGERVLITRLHLFNTWVKKYNHADLYSIMRDQNLELLRERLVQTVKFSDEERPPLP
eukprot:TRINITY_DN16577_c0_g1_i1.p1 TRINITY_DN16577_c0_g1~~TRINITY_DN16577_c0_g1_i1.p1  ORF type:complete len:214 (-),score=34.40 TRINITY_DN16577_c0_g1_i1:721-1332(-)